MARRMSTADRRAWEAARTLDDLGELTARWLEGGVASQPAYAPGCGPDPETVPLIARAGLLQPGRVRDLRVAARRGRAPAMTVPGGNSAPRCRASPAPRWPERIWEAAEAAGLTVIAHAPATLPRWRIRYDRAVPVTRREARPYTWFGAQLSRRHLRDGWTGYGICHPGAVTALCAAWQVTVIDPRLGPQRPALAGPAQRPGHRAPTPARPRDPAAALSALGAVWSPDFGAYASGQLDASQIRCVLCGHAPCGCPPFGTPAYLALVDRLHGRTRGGEA